jgi:hypothetical protein
VNYDRALVNDHTISSVAHVRTQCTNQEDSKSQAPLSRTCFASFAKYYTTTVIARDSTGALQAQAVLGKDSQEYHQAMRSNPFHAVRCTSRHWQGGTDHDPSCCLGKDDVTHVRPGHTARRIPWSLPDHVTTVDVVARGGVFEHLSSFTPSQDLTC